MLNQFTTWISQTPVTFSECMAIEVVAEWGEIEHEARVVTVHFYKLSVVTVYAPAPSSPE